jgi:signal transduction histidine kinase
MLLLIVYLTVTQPDLKVVRSRLNAVLPFIVLSFLSDLVENLFPSFYKKWDDYFDNSILFALLWMFVMWQVGNKQKKDLEKERIKTKEREIEISRTSALKAQLEIQVSERTAELTKQKEELENALHNLKSTQAQLIQSEKMASLGELTAGIAHEIQNPLNFVNNFSEVSVELLEELKSEKFKAESERDPELENELLHDLTQNLEKIAFHGKRADGIVKGMLQHSRASSATKEPTDINALADEYLRLSYHGLRAKDKSFNADFKTDFDAGIDQVNIVPQDMGRVLLNLYNNGFYSVTEKKKALALKGEKYEPTVWVSTKRISSLLVGGAGKLEIIVKDNGNGVPQQVVDKIFQPFFTTKPTGQGTGLGLSMSYDIIKAHGGEMKVNTVEGEGAEFVIVLPEEAFMK